MGESNIGGRLQALVDRLAAKRQIHSVVVGIRSPDGRVDASAAAGFADTGRSVAMTSGTPYFVASITKMFTATVVMKLADAGRIDLDDSISEYLSSHLLERVHVVDGTDYSDHITVLQLLDQTSGLADYFEGKPMGGVSLADLLREGRDRALSIDEVMDMVRHLPPEFAPGTDGGNRAHYSDTNYALLGAIIEAATETTVTENFRDTIFAPLGLNDTYVFGDRQPRATPAAFYFKDKAIEIPLAMASFAPDGGVVSTVDDSLRFLHAFFGGELVTADQLAFMTRRWNRFVFPIEYGTGLMRFKPPRWMTPFQAPLELVGHSGSTGSFAFHDPKRNLYVCGTVNQMQGQGRPYRLMTRMINLL